MRKKVVKSLWHTARPIPYLLLAIASLVIVATRYKEQLYKDTKLDELLFYLLNGVQGAGSDSFEKALLDNTVYLIIIFLIFCIPIIDFYRDNITVHFSYISNAKLKKFVFNPSRIRLRYKLGYGFVVLLMAVGQGLHSIGFIQYSKSLFSTSQIFETEYIDSANVNIKLPDSKRNLIYIYLESVENTLASRTVGGASETSLIPELESLALNPKNISFSNTDGIGGGVGLAAAGWTVGAMTAQTTGTPLKTVGQISLNQIGTFNSFLPGAYGIGEVLEKEGYNQELLIGSDAVFGGRDKLYKQHGNYTVFDLETARDKGLIPRDYQTWWGYEDSKLFDYAKSEILELSSKEAPFNFQMLTADTHPVDGYKDETCPSTFADQYKNVYACSSARVNELVTWIQQQDFYKDTTIVITGDHLGMQTVFFDGIIGENKGYERTIYNVFVNPASKTKYSHNRLFSSFDMYPTTLAAMGATIDGDRLGFGVNLFSDKQTLVEKYGKEKLDAEISKRSEYYNNKIMRED